MENCGSFKSFGFIYIYIYIYIYIANLIMEVPRILICVVSESLLTDVDSRARWVDSASSRHVAKMRDFFVDMKRLKPVIIVCTWEITNIVMC